MTELEERMAMTDRPNIVLIFPDQHRGDTMGCAGNPAAQTPNLDRLAAEGVLFERCLTNSPLCMPARASLITGQHVNRHGIWGNNLVEPDRYGPSHVRNIRDSGFHTAIFGKTHLYANYKNDGHTRDHAHKLKDWGYETSHELRDVVPSSRCNCYYADFLEERGRLRLYQDYTRLWWTTGFRGLSHPWEDPPSPLPTDEHIDMYCADKAAAWIRDYEAENPFYLQVCFTGPHTPFDSPAEYRDRFNPEEMPLAIMDPPAAPVSPQVERQVKAGRLQNMTESHSRVMRTYYYAKVALIDHGVGMVIQALQDKGILDNTWIIYTSDHGDMLGDHRLNQKLVFYQGAVDVPLIIRPPGKVPAWRTRGLTDHLDVSATLLDIAGAPPLADSPGHSLAAKVVAGPTAPGAQQGKDVVFSEVERYYAMARDERYKMAINAISRQPLELYDLVEDPQEQRNLVHEPGLSGVREEMLHAYFDQLLGLDQEKLDSYKEALKAKPDTDTFVTDLISQFR